MGGEIGGGEIGGGEITGARLRVQNAVAPRAAPHGFAVSIGRPLMWQCDGDRNGRGRDADYSASLPRPKHARALFGKEYQRLPMVRTTPSGSSRPISQAWVPSLMAP